MILVDTNLLLYAKVADFQQHAAARAWLDARLNGPAGVALPWSTLLAFTRLITNPRVFSRPLSMEDAWAQVEEWKAQPTVFSPEPAQRHAEILSGLVRRTVQRSNLLPDAHLAALAIEYGLTLCSVDSDFARFDALSWVNPLDP